MGLAYFTRRAARVGSLGLNRVKSTAAGIVAAAAAKQAAKTVIRKATRAKRQSRSIRKPYRTNKHKKSRALKPITQRLPKNLRKFQRKVEKVINHTTNFGKYSYLADARLFQGGRDIWGLIFADENGQRFYLDSYLHAADAVSVLFNNKTMRADCQNTTGNLDNKERFAIESYFMKMEFKSTSTFVMEVELYECTAKDHTNLAAQDLLTGSLNDYNNRFLSNLGGGTTWDFSYPGSVLTDATSLMSTYTVKKQQFFMKPGSTHVKYFKKGNKVYEPSDYLRTDTNNPFSFEKGSTQYFFRVRTLPEVSGFSAPRTAGTPSSWNNAANGGIALRYTRVIKCSPPISGPDLSNEKSCVAIGNWWTLNAANYSAQTITLNNPIGIASSI